MKLSSAAIEALASPQHRPTRFILCATLMVTEKWINDLLKKNDTNGPLTKYAALKVINEKTGLPLEAILDGELIHA